MLDERTMVHWHEADLTWIDECDSQVYFPSAIMAICKDGPGTTNQGPGGSSPLDFGNLWGQNVFLGGRAFMHDLANLQLAHRLQFVAVH